MSYPHVINLREPWQRETSENGTRQSRSFRWPTELDTNEKVWVVIENGSLPGQVECNGHELGPLSTEHRDTQFNISSVLLPENKIIIEYAFSGESHTPLGPVRLEVRMAPVA